MAEWDCEVGRSRIVGGPGALERIGELARELGARRALLVTDRGLRRAGHVDRALAALQRAGIACVVFEDVIETPTTREVEAAAALARSEGIDSIVAVGGGSAMDCAKGANFLVTNGGRMEDYWGTAKASQPMLPSLAAPTTSGTGSEAQSYALIAQAETRRKMACGDKKASFRTVILDPTLPVTAPRAVAAAAGLDALSHAVESYVTLRRNPVSQMLAHRAWQALDTAFERVLAQPQDLAAQERMQVGAFLAGAAIEQSMLGAAHSLANPLTARHPIAHGAAVALFLPHVVRFNAGIVRPLYEELAPRLEDRLLELRRLAGLPESLRDVSVARQRLPEMAEEASEQWTAGFNPRPVTKQDLLGLYEAAY